MSPHTIDRKDVMLGLLYPAVLGTVLYSALTVTVGPLVRFVARLAGDELSPQEVPAVVGTKGVVLALTFLFYLCDYFYVMFTSHYRWWFFGYSCLFLIGLCVTATAVNASTDYPPRLAVVAACYFAFMVSYFAWDLDELIRGSKPAERRFYVVVLTWEAIAATAFFVMMKRLGSGAAEAEAFIRLLLANTFAFAIVAFIKWRLYVHHYAPNASNATEAAA